MLFRRSFEEFMRYQRIPRDTDMSREQIEKMKKIPIQLDYLTVDDEDITGTRMLVSFQKDEPTETFGVGIVLSIIGEPKASWSVHMDVLPENIKDKLKKIREGKTLIHYAGLDLVGNIFYTSAGNPLFYRMLQNKIGYRCVSGQHLGNLRRFNSKLIRS